VKIIAIADSSFDRSCHRHRHHAHAKPVGACSASCSATNSNWNNRDASARTFVDGWLRTGDKYWRDADDYYYYAGRADDMLKVRGIWVSPIEVEAALRQHPRVLDVAVVGAVDADSLIKPKAFVVVRNPSEARAELADELRQFVRRLLAPYKCPRWIEFRAELPRTIAGKLRRNVLRNE
jgi:acyl-coenzyme A synthetase/AMP-(fatty) acid ligase